MTSFRSINKNGIYENLSQTPDLAEGASYWSVIKKSLKRPKNARPSYTLPSVKTDLKKFFFETPAIIWFGHSSYLIHIAGKNILVDPVLSGYASPIPTMVKAFDGSDVYKPEDMPPIDVLVITHNHYDHMDKCCIEKLLPAAGIVLTTLNNRKFFPKEYQSKIKELDWWQSLSPLPELNFTATPARHFSGRGLKRNQSLWTSFVLEWHRYKIFIGGDSGYDKHFKEIGKCFGPFDLAILECGQYDYYWPYIHSFPEEVIQEAIELNAKELFPVHWSKFALANHPWNEPIERVTAIAHEKNIPVATPQIGEPYLLGKEQNFSQWWKANVS